MKDKRDTKTLSLGLAKTNAERQQEYRERNKKSADCVRLNTYISSKASSNLSLIMQMHKLTKKEALIAVLESLSEQHIKALIDAAPN